MKTFITLTFLLCTSISFYSCKKQNSNKTSKQEFTLTKKTLDKYLVEKPRGKNSHKAKKSPYVLLISLDGFRHDYIDLYKPKTLLKFRKQGTFAKSLIPVFPSKTFTNHLSIITGSYPENHGIVANSFYDPNLERIYSLGRKKEVAKGEWYQREPIWVHLERQKLLTACFFWPGSSAKINNISPSYYLKYFHKMPHKNRINKVVEWLKLPEETRPHFLTLYFSDVDSAGHKYGPYSKQVKNAIKKVDESLEQLFLKLDKLNLPLNTIIVSDHGMLDLNEKKHQWITNNTNLEDFHVQGTGPVSFLYYIGDKNKKKSIINKTYQSLKKHSRYINVYKRNKLPKHYKLNNPRAGDLILVSYPNYSIAIKGKRSNLKLKGNHGYDPYQTIDMHGIFMANGPLLKNEYFIESFENIHIYPLILKLLNTKENSNIDGNKEVLSKIIIKD
jgi:predicted AlkP superfamily pyrophosphatase or phosphodiesterase